MLRALAGKGFPYFRQPGEKIISRSEEKSYDDDTVCASISENVGR